MPIDPTTPPISISSPLTSAVAQTGGLHPQPPKISDDERETLTKLVSAVHDAALNPTALEYLATAVLRNERTPAAMRLAALLLSPTDPNARPSVGGVSGGAPVMPDATQAVARHKIQIPDAIATVSGNSVVSFPGTLRAPEDFILLAEHQVPFEYVELISRIGSDQTARLNESRARVLVHQLHSDKRLYTWITASPPVSGADAAPYPELRFAPALFEDWTRQGLTTEQQAIAAGFMVQGFDQAWAETVTKRHSQNLIPLRAWLTYSRDVDLSFRLDNVMTEAVPRWLEESGNDLPISAPVLACLPAMIQSDMKVRHIDRIWLARHSPAVFRELNEVFKPDAPVNAAQQVRYGLTNARQLTDRIINRKEKSQEIVEAEAEQLRNVPELNKKAAHTRDELRRLLHAIKNLHPGMAFLAPHSRLCTRFANAWQDTIATLNELLRAESDPGAMQPKELIDKLSRLHAYLNSEITELEEPQETLGLQQLA